jgi:6-phosphogluconolactonase
MRASSLTSSLAVASLVMLGCATTAPQPPVGPGSGQAIVYVGGYRPQISVFGLDLRTGKLTPRSATAAGTAPSFLAWDPSMSHLYAVDEVEVGRVRAFAIRPGDGALSPLNDVSSAGVGPAHLSVDRSGHYVLVANYADTKSGTIAVLPIEENGRLGQAVDSKDFGPGTMPHMIAAEPSNQYVFVPCKGGPFVAQFAFDPSSGHLTPGEPDRVAAPPHSGPRHLAFHPTLDLAYLINEQAMTVTVYDRSGGQLTPLQTVSTLPAGVLPGGKGLSTAEIEVHPSGKFLYGSNRGHNSIVIYRIDDAGRLTVLGHETRNISKPRHFQIVPTGSLMLVANQDTDTITVFAIDQVTGALAPMGAPTPAGKQPSFVGAVIFPAPARP